MNLDVVQRSLYRLSMRSGGTRMGVTAALALLLTVADTGVGIPIADQARVFEKFERGVRQPGAGLGLSLVKSLIELHGGAVVIESASGQGTRITCRLPVAQPTTAA